MVTYGQDYTNERYGLLLHLNECCKAEPKYSVLIHALYLDSINAANMLESLPTLFEYYSKHDGSHSLSIISNIEQLLGADRIKSLSPTDCWLLLMSAIMHDVGMRYDEKWVHELFKDESFHDYVMHQRESVIKELRTAAMFFLQSSGRYVRLEELNPHKESASAVEDVWFYHYYLKQLVGGYQRKKHAERSSMIIHGEINTYTHYGVIPERLIKQVADIAIAHALNQEDILENYLLETNGFHNDYAHPRFVAAMLPHPRFVAAMLRFGDVMDTDNNRVNPLMEAMYGGGPSDSMAHYRKHKGITHILVRPDTIEIGADLSGLKQEEFASVFQVTNEWFQWIEDEIKFLNKNWFRLVPEGFTGRAPWLDKRQITVYREKIDRADVLRDFQITYGRAYKIIEGKNLYSGSLPFLRETVQNGFDATKLQIFRELNAQNQQQIIDFIGKPEWDENKQNHKGEIRTNLRKNVYVELAHFLLFTMNISEQNYAVTLLLRELEKETLDEIEEAGCSNTESRKGYHETATFRICVADNGIGIDKFAIRRMQNIGSNQTEDRMREVEHMPAWLRPTGEFGIGIHSIFSVTDSFDILTCSKNNSFDAELKLYSAKNGGRILINTGKLRKYNKRARNGTTVAFDVRVSDLLKLIEPGLLIPQQYKINFAVITDMIAHAVNLMLAPNVMPLKLQSTNQWGINNGIIMQIPSVFDDLINTLKEELNSQKNENNSDAMSPTTEQLANCIQKRKLDRCILWETVAKESVGKAVNTYSALYGLDSCETGGENRQMLINVQFVPLTMLENTGVRVSYKGSWLLQAGRQFEFPYLALEVHLLGAEADNLITIQRDYLLPDVVEGIRKDILYTILVILERQIIKELPDAITEDTAFSIGLYLWLWRWAIETDERKDIWRDESAVAFINRIADEQTAENLTAYTYHDGYLQLRSASGKEILKEPLEQYYFKGKVPIGLEVKIDENNTDKQMTNGTRIYTNIWHNMPAALHIQTIHAWMDVKNGRCIYAIRYNIKRCEIANMSDKTFTIMLNDHLERGFRYVPCPSKYRKIRAEHPDYQALSAWPECDSFLRIPVILEDFNSNFERCSRLFDEVRRGIDPDLLRMYLFDNSIFAQTYNPSSSELSHDQMNSRLDILRELLKELAETPAMKRKLS